MSVGIVALGPAVLLPILSRRRKRWYAGRCDACGYDMTGTPSADRCPECGAGWRP
jgi:rubrerythrin